MQRYLPSAFIVTMLASGTFVAALADDDARPLSSQSASARLAARDQPSPLKIVAQPAPQHVYLIRTTLLTLGAANRTGNYTVLRDHAAPGFRDRNTAADLAQAFQTVRKSLDLGAAALRQPVLSRAPVINKEQQLQLTGQVPSEPTTIAFDMVFEPVGGHWRLSALAVGAAPAKR